MATLWQPVLYSVLVDWYTLIRFSNKLPHCMMSLWVRHCHCQWVCNVSALMTFDWGDYSNNWFYSIVNWCSIWELSPFYGLGLCVGLATTSPPAICNYPCAIIKRNSSEIMYTTSSTLHFTCLVDCVFRIYICCKILIMHVFIV